MRFNRNLTTCLLAALCVSSLSLPAFGQKKNDKADARAAKVQEALTEADALAKDQKFTEAFKLYDQAIRTDSGSAEAYFRRGMANLKARRIKTGLTDCEQALRIGGSDYAEAYH